MIRRLFPTRLDLPVLVCCAFWSMTPAPAMAQQPAAETRAEDAEATRREKAEALQPNVPTRAESTLLYIEDSRLLGRIFNPPAGWFVQVGGLSEGSGLAIGGGHRLATGLGSALDVRGLVSIGRAFLVDTTWRSDPDLIDRVAFTANAAIERHANQRFYGLGPHTTRTFDSTYGVDERRAEGQLEGRVTSWLTLHAGGGLARTTLRDLDFDFESDDDSDDDVVVDDVQVQQFRNGGIPGLDGRHDWASAFVGLLLDTREGGRAGGSRVLLRQTTSRDRNDTSHDFSATRIEMQQFVPVWSGTRVFALSAIADRVTSPNGQTVPFYLQPTVGGSRSLRGLDRQRYRDTSALLLQAEYRYEVNPFVSGALFIETGQVAPDWKNMRGREFETDYGAGLRIGYGQVVALRTDVAFGGEGVRLIIALNGVF